MQAFTNTYVLISILLWMDKGKLDARRAPNGDAVFYFAADDPEANKILKTNDRSFGLRDML